jgi:hypothetical protein
MAVYLKSVVGWLLLVDAAAKYLFALFHIPLHSNGNLKLGFFTTGGQVLKIFLRP